MPFTGQYTEVPHLPPAMVVQTGNVTVEGVVANEGDKNIANIQAKGVEGVFSVPDNLGIEK